MPNKIEKLKIGKKIWVVWEDDPEWGPTETVGLLAADQEGFLGIRDGKTLIAIDKRYILACGHFKKDYMRSREPG